MSTTRPIVSSKLFAAKLWSKFFADQGLTKKAYLNAVASFLDYGASLVVGFILTPLLVAGLGQYSFGMWQILNRLVGYITPASGRSTQVLKFTLANRQASTDYDEKRRYVGSALVVWALFLPIMGTLGGILVWVAPGWLRTAADFSPLARWTTVFLVANLAFSSLFAIPQAVLEGENLGYKRMGLTVGLVLVCGALTWVSLYFHTGIIGVAAAVLAGTVLTGVVYLGIVRTYAPWFGIARPSGMMTRQFFGLSWWFLAWNLVMNLMMASDVVILGLMQSVEGVTSYTLTKYAPETLISVVAIIAFSIAPGLGGVIGSGNLKKATAVRTEIMSITWLTITVLGTVILLWNETFMALWVGPQYYPGALPSLLIVLVVAQFVLIRNDGNIIDLTLRLSHKVILGGVSVALSLGTAALFVGKFHMGVVGLCLGMLLGRMLLSLGYPMLLGRFLDLPLSQQLRGAVRPALLTLVLFVPAAVKSSSVSAMRQEGLGGWVVLALAVLFTTVLVFPVAFFGGLPQEQRNNMVRRVRMVLGI